MSDLGDRVHARRKELRWSLRELGQRASLSATFLCEIEKGKRSVGADTLFRLSQVLGMPMDQLMQGTTRRTAGIEVRLPSSLMRYASGADIPFRQAMCCYWLMRTIMDHRIPSRRIDLEKVDWQRFHEAVKEWL